MSALARSRGPLWLSAAVLAVVVFSTTAKDNPGLKRRIAVMTFEDKSGGGDQLGAGIADKVTTALVKSGSYIVLESGHQPAAQHRGNKSRDNRGDRRERQIGQGQDQGRQRIQDR